MNKILNWTFGACFRTLGRFLAIFIVFILLLFIGSKLDINLPDWLGIAKVSAKTSGYYISAMYKEPALTNQYSFNNKYGGYYSQVNAETTDIKFYFNNIPVSQNEYIFVPITFYTTNAVGEYNETNNGIFNLEAGISVRALYSNGYMSSCYALEFNKNNNKIIYKCNINSGASYLNGFRIYINDLSISGDYLEALSYIGVGDTLDLELSSNNTIIQNQEQTNDKLDDVNQSLQDTNQSIQDTNNNIMNSDSPNVSGMTDLAGYLPPGPLDSVLNLPLSILNSLNSKLSSSCSPLSLILPFVNLPLNIPCLSTIFSQISGLNALWETIGVILGALIMYKYLTYLYNWVDDVTSLRHTRARLFGAKSDADNWGGVD